VKTVELQVTSDFICPWCWIGHRNLKAAIERDSRDAGLRVVYAPFELNPDMPKAGMNRRRYRSAKFGSWERSQAMDADVTLAGKRVGVDFNYDIVEVTPNTRLAHRAMFFAQAQGDASRSDALFEAIFSAYFSEGRDIGALEVLVAIAAAQGFDAGAVRTFLQGIDGEREVAALERQAQAAGVNAVPTFRIGDTQVSGAQPASLLAQALQAVSSEVKVA
jgi:predicted DsbA family dithiol-disulfide isomerase